MPGGIRLAVEGTPCKPIAGLARAEDSGSPALDGLHGRSGPDAGRAGGFRIRRAPRTEREAHRA